MAEGERVASGLGAIVPALPLSAVLGPYIWHPPTKFLDTIVSIAAEGCIPEVKRYAEITYTTAVDLRKICVFVMFVFLFLGLVRYPIIEKSVASS